MVGCVNVGLLLDPHFRSCLERSEELWQLWLGVEGLRFRVQGLFRFPSRGAVLPGPRNLAPHLNQTS